MNGPFVYDLPAVVLCDFCWVMDALSDLDWTRFASEVLGDQTTVRLAQKKESRTAWVMNQWGSRKGQISQLVDLLDRLRLFRPRDIILAWSAGWKPPFQAPPPLPPPVAAARPSVPPSLAQLAPPSKPPQSQPASHTCLLSPQTDKASARPLPRPAPPPSSLHSNCLLPPQPPPPPEAALNSGGGGSSGVMCWSYDEVYAGTEGFSPSLRVGEGGFGVVYRASLKNTDCAVKRLKQDCLLDWELLKESFHTELDKLSKFRHPNIISLLGFSEGLGSVCLIYTYMDNMSLEDQLHSEDSLLSWPQRVSVVKEASTALQFLHCPPEGHRVLIHGDVKSSNILLDRHMTAKLADFGLARFAPRGSPTQTTTVGRTATVRGTFAYLPEEYVRGGKLSTAVDAFSFGVVLLEVLTGRRALQTDRRCGDRYLKDLVDEVEDEEGWKKQLDRRLVAGGAAVPGRSLEVAALACRCLDRVRKRRPAMTEVFERLREIDGDIGRASSSQPLPPPPDFSASLLAHGLSRLGPLEDVYDPSRTSSSSISTTSSSSSSSPALSHSLHSSSLPLSPPPSSFTGPCETDESRGCSQYDLGSQPRADGTGSSPCGSQSPGDQQHRATPADSQFSQPSVPTEDQYNFPPQPGGSGSSSSRSGGGASAGTGPDSFSPVRSLQSVFPGPTVVVNPSKRHFLQKKALYEEGRIETPELLSSADLYGEQTCDTSRGPEESDELEFLPVKGH